MSFAHFAFFNEKKRRYLGFFVILFAVCDKIFWLKVKSCCV